MDGGSREKGRCPGGVSAEQAALAEKIREIDRASHLDEETRTRLIAQLLSTGTGARPDPGRLAAGYLLSFLLPPTGLLVAVHCRVRYGENGRRPAAIATILTVISLFIARHLFRALAQTLTG